MAKKMAVINYGVCQPERCDSGMCSASLACPRKLLRQEAPYDSPMSNAPLCQGCAKCVLACPLKAISLE